MTRVIAFNWKMHLGPVSARPFMATFLAEYAPHTDRTIVFVPPAASLTTVSELVASRAEIVVGAQNIYWEEKGAFTGEMSGGIAREAGATRTLVGHSERRRRFGETDADTAKKCAAAIRSGLVPILCVGETDDERRTGRTSDVIARQIRAGVVELSPDAIAGMVIAYEPVWAIGTGKNATPEDASLGHTFIRGILDELTGGRGNQVPILYGGSVTAANCPDLLLAAHVDGLLVGGASLDPHVCAQLARA